MNFRSLGDGPRQDSFKVPKKVVVGYAEGPPFQRLASVSRPLWQEYAHRRGASFYWPQQVRELGRPAAWSKIALLQAALKENDVALWVDSDCMPLRFEEDIFSEVHPGTDVALVLDAYDGEDIPNTGVMVVRSTTASFEFLDKVWNQRDLIEHAWWENAAVIRVLGFSSSKIAGEALLPIDGLRVQYIAKKWNQTFSNLIGGASFIHFPGVQNGVREVLMSSFAFAMFSDFYSTRPEVAAKLLLTRKKALDGLHQALKIQEMFSLRAWLNRIGSLARFVRGSRSRPSNS